MALPNRTLPSLLNFLTGLVQFSTYLQLYKKLPITNEKIHFLNIKCTIHIDNITAMQPNAEG